MAHAELDKVHRKGITHLKSGGKKGSGLDDHVNKAKDRIGKSVDRIKNSAKSRIREVAGCDDEGEGFSTRGAGMAGSRCFPEGKKDSSKEKRLWISNAWSWL